MLHLTDTARVFLADLLKEAEAPEDIAVRIVIENDEIALRQSSEIPGDQTFRHEDRTVLLLDPDAAELLAETTLDASGDRLVLHPPESKP